MDGATEAFKRAQWRYLQSPESLPNGKSFHLENTHNWFEVMEMAKEAARNYDQRGGRLQRLLRKGVIAFGKSGDLTMAWVQLLPAGDYGSVVSGGIKLILTVSKFLCFCVMWPLIKGSGMYSHERCPYGSSRHIREAPR